MTLPTVDKIDSRPATWEHIHEVHRGLTVVAKDLLDRALDHDQTKLVAPEVDLFDTYTPMLAVLTYGSDEYAESLAALRPALDHHYSTYRHHPEHHENGIHDMNLMDMVEMLVDWVAATKRHPDGDVRRSIDLNAERFGYGDAIKRLLHNTIDAWEQA